MSKKNPPKSVPPGGLNPQTWGDNWSPPPFIGDLPDDLKLLKDLVYPSTVGVGNIPGPVQPIRLTPPILTPVFPWSPIPPEHTPPSLSEFSIPVLHNDYELLRHLANIGIQEVLKVIPRAAILKFLKNQVE